VPARRGGVGRSRNAAELMTLAGALHGAGIQLELLTGPMTGIDDPAGMGSMLFAVRAVAAQLDRDCIRALREAGTPMPKIARTGTINTGKNAGNHPSVASLYRALAEAANIA
jgi:Resolvase, N terminal domain